MISMISDSFKGFAFKWRSNMCSLEKAAYRATKEKQKAPIIRTSGMRGRTQL